MEDIDCWQMKFQPCQYSEKLVDKLKLLNITANESVDIREVKKLFIMPESTMGTKKGFLESPTIPTR